MVRCAHEPQFVKGGIALFSSLFHVHLPYWTRVAFYALVYLPMLWTFMVREIFQQKKKTDQIQVVLLGVAISAAGYIVL